MKMASSLRVPRRRSKLALRKPFVIPSLGLLIITAAAAGTLRFGSVSNSTPQPQDFHAEYTRAFGRTPPAGMDAWLSLATERQCLTSAADYAPLYRTLGLFWRQPRPGITAAMLDRSRGLPLLNRIRFQGGRIVGPIHQDLHPIWTSVAARLEADGGGGDLELLQSGMDEPRALYPEHLPTSIPSYDALAKMPTSDIAVVRRACGYEASQSSFMRNPASLDTVNELIPVLSPATVAGCFADLVVPYFIHVADLNFDDPSNTTWESKREEIFWRGGSSGTNLRGLNRTTWLEMNDRLRMVDRFKNKPGIDLGITSYYQIRGSPGASESQVKSALEHELGVATGTDYPGHWAYKYLLDVDGNTYSRRFVTFLRNSRSLVLKATIFEDWPTLFMRPWKHYIPVSTTLDDLEDKLEYLKQHDEEAQTIADDGFDRARRYLRKDDIECYLYRLLVEYRQLYRMGHGLPT